MASRQSKVSVAWPDDYLTVAGMPMMPSKQQIAPPGVAEPDSSDKSRRKSSEAVKTKKLQMTKRGRAAARRNQKVASGTPRTMPSSRQRMRQGMNPTQNNPNDVGAVIIPQGTPSTL